MDGKLFSPFTIIEAGIKLSFNEETIATACVFYHTYYTTAPDADVDEELLVMATLSLASKVQEQLTKIGDVVNTCYRCMYKDKAPLEVGDLYWHLKESVGKYELVLLRSLKFNMHVQLPHPYLCHFLLALARWVDKEVWERSHVARVSWALLQDCFTTNLCLQEPPHVMAVSVLYLALHCCQLKIPGSEQARRQWWQVFCPESPEEKLQDMSVQIMQCITAANGKVT